jgi:hypothetical protein
MHEGALRADGAAQQIVDAYKAEARAQGLVRRRMFRNVA